MKGKALLLGCLLAGLVPRPASAQLLEMRQIIFGMD